jgi:hypothetical protein
MFLDSVPASFDRLYQKSDTAQLQGPVIHVHLRTHRSRGASHRAHDEIAVLDLVMIGAAPPKLDGGSVIQLGSDRIVDRYVPGE